MTKGRRAEPEITNRRYGSADSSRFLLDGIRLLVLTQSIPMPRLHQDPQSVYARRGGAAPDQCVSASEGRGPLPVFCRSCLLYRVAASANNLRPASIAGLTADGSNNFRFMRQLLVRNNRCPSATASEARIRRAMAAPVSKHTLCSSFRYASSRMPSSTPYLYQSGLLFRLRLLFRLHGSNQFRT